MIETKKTELSRHDIVTHNRTGEFYRIAGFPKVRIGPAWVAGVAYHAVDDMGDGYVRELVDFKANFKVVQ